MYMLRTWRALVARGLWLLAAAWLATAAHAAPSDEEGVRSVLMKTFDRPEARLTVEPVVVSGDHALAGWLQGERGGRALLRRTDQGWQVHVCGGDGLKDLAALRDAGVGASTAQSLVGALVAAERKLPPEQVRRYALFGQNVRVGPGHGGGDTHPGGHPTPAVLGASAAHGH